MSMSLSQASETLVPGYMHSFLPPVLSGGSESSIVDASLEDLWKAGFRLQNGNTKVQDP